MAIDAYVGLPGHGKSYGVVEHVIIPSLKQGRHVVTNIPLEIDALLADFGGTIQQLPDDWHELEDLADYAVNGCVLVLDELWRRWPSGMLTNQANIADKSLLAEHRHRVDKQNRSMRIVLVTQDLSQIASWVRVLVESTYRISKKTKNYYVVSIYSGSVTGTRPPKSALLRQTSGKFKKSVYVYYSSATQSETGTVGDESVADGRANILKSWGLWGLISIAVIGGIVGVRGLVSFFTPATIETKKEVKPQPQPQPQPKPAPTAIARASQEIYKDVVTTPATPPQSTLWRVGGYVRAYGEKTEKAAERVALVSGSRVRYVDISQCKFFDNGLDVFCDLNGERVTPWSGGGAVTTVFQPNQYQQADQLQR